MFSSFPQSQQRDLNPGPWVDDATVLPLHHCHWPATTIHYGDIMFMTLSLIQLVLSVDNNFKKEQSYQQYRAVTVK